MQRKMQRGNPIQIKVRFSLIYTLCYNAHQNSKTPLLAHRMKYLLLILAFFFTQLAFAQVTIENCKNGIDDDGDGLVDCADVFQCAGESDCAFEDRNFNCADGFDNDGDGDIDCADSECDCTGVEICNNLLDDDGDGLVDCADTVGVSHCIDFVGCERECNNGVDDDGDGFFDYYDGDCVDHPDNPNDYIVTKPDCEARPVDNIFNVNEAWRSPRNTANNRGIPIVADIDNDNTPEVITFDQNTIRILNGKDGTVEASYTYPNDGSGDAFEATAVADVDNDGYGEIFHINDQGWVRAMDYDPINGITLKWKKKQSKTLLRFPALADFNQDGKVELYYGNEIRDAVTGDLLVTGSHGTNTYPNGNHWKEELNGLPVAVDILPASECATCNGLELVLGHVIYAVNLTGGTLTEVKTMDDPAVTKTGYTGDYRVKTSFGDQSPNTTAVVDYNQDGYLDVLMSGAVDRHDGPAAVFFWDVHNQTSKAFLVTRPANTIPGAFRNLYKNANSNNCDNGNDCHWIRGLGSINVANIDSDPELECTFMSGSSLYAIDVNMQPEWTQNLFVNTTDPAHAINGGPPVNGNHVDFWESTSGITGTAVFDFDGDGASEVIYRDQVDLYVVDGESGRVLNSQYTNLTKCSSNTAYEYPIIADVDGDGETEIVVTCSRVENEKYKGPNTNGGTDGHVRVYKAAPDMFWVPARQIWNQFTYFNVNINDNLTVPRYQQPHHLNFAQICIDPSAPNNFSLNKFLNQSPRITFCGDLAFPAAKLDFPDDAVTITPPICPVDTFQVQIKFQNTGDYAVLQPIPFAFYAADPAQKYLNSVPNPWLDTVYVSVPGGVQPGQLVDTTVTVRGARGEFSLFVSMNDIGPFDKNTKNALANEDFYALTALNGTVRECDATPTIVSKSVKAVPFRIQTTAYDNRRCSDVIGVNNGQIQVTDEDGKPFTPLSNYELTLVNTRTNDTIDVSALRADLDSGTFITGLDSATYALSVSYTNDAYSCGSTTDTLRINRVEGWPGNEQLKITKLKDVSSCKPNTFNGAAQVQVYEGDSLLNMDNYEVTFFQEQRGDVFLDDSVTTLGPFTYEIFVTNIVTGCSLNDSSLVMDLPLPQLGEPTVTPVTNCRTPDGSVTAVMQAGDIADYEFYLIEEFDAQDTLKSTTGVFTNLREGLYELKAYDPNNDCGLYSDGKDVEIKRKVGLPALTLSQVSAQTACDLTKANGHLRVEPSIDGDYTYTWYKGTVTTGSTAVEVGKATDTPGDATGLYTYGNPTQRFTVKVLDNNTGCDTLAAIDLHTQITYPTPQATATPRTYCATLNGTISASVGGNIANYTFSLYEGTTATGDTLATSPDGSFTGLDSINYTIVATDTATGCATPAPLAFTIKVPGNTKAPVVVPTVTPQSSCDLADPNGAISVTADGSTSTSDYTFTWTLPSGTTTTGTTLSDLPYGSYQLTVLDNTTGCDTTLIVPVENNILENALLTLTTNDVTDCTPYNGRVEITEVNGTSTDLGDYTFEWYEIAESGFDSTLIAGVTGPVLSGQAEGTFSVQGFNTLTKCTTASKRATVGTTVPQPVIEIVPDGPLVDDCFDRDGVFKLDVKLGGVDVTDQYDYDWYLGATVEPSSYLQSGATITGIVAGTFTIVATSLADHGCATTAVIDMVDVVDFLPVILGDPTATHIEQCVNPANTGTVSANVKIILAPDAQHDDQDDYAFYWFAGKQLPPLPGGLPGEIDTTQAFTSILDTTKPSARGTAGVGHTLAGREPGFYTVAVFNIVDGCYASKFTEVKQIAREPLVTRDNRTPQTLCSSPEDGSLSVSAKKRNGDTTDPTPGYSFEWYQGTNAATPSSATYITTTSGTSSTLSNQPAGQYTVRVTDLQTNCDIEQTNTILDERNLPAVTKAQPKGVDICNVNNGSITVTQVNSGSNVITDPAVFASDYTFYLYNQESDYSQSSPATNSLSTAGNNYTFENLAVGTYYLAVSDDNNGCPSPFLHPVEVRDEVPKMSLDLITQETFVECTPLNEGELSIIVQNTTDAEFTWYAGADISTPPVNVANITSTATQSTLVNLMAGEYTVVVTDRNNIACDLPPQTFTVPSKQVTPILAVNKLSDQTNCNLPNGSVEVTSVTLNGNSEPLGGYNYTWYLGQVDSDGKDDFDAAYGTTGTATDLAFSNLAAGTYFITAQGNGTGTGTCPTNTVQVIITDESVDLQVVDDFISEPIVACDPSNFEEGEIEIKVLNSTTFTTEWYRGNQVDPSQRFLGRVDQAGNTVSLDKNTSIGGSTTGNLLIANLATPTIPDTLTALTPGVYTVRVTDNNNVLCPAVRRYTIQGIAVPLAAFPSARPQTSCQTDNGAVAVTINGGKGEPHVNWYAGPTATGTPINNGAYLVENLPAGVYTVTVLDSADLSCGIVTEQITVEDNRGNDLQIVVSPDFPMTNCDDANPNGQLSARITKPLARYEFFWYEGTNTAANPIALGPTVTNLAENTYSVIARDRITGCLSEPFTGQVTTLLDSGLLPAPTVRMISPVTRCANPDGVAQATLDSALTVDPNVDYEFIWTDAQGNVILSTSRTNVAEQLDTGRYEVVARNTITGCRSLPGSVHIGLQLKVPEFEIVTTVSSCNEPSGTLSLNLYEPLEIVNIAWVTPYGENNGFFLDEQPAGTYTATLTDASGCSYTQEATVLPNIEIYNAVSPNGDQKNDIFTISCIEDYENNIVRIYNRAGSLVYQHRGYDNQTIFFEGFGNQGLYVGKKELPDGTYFYIVDKQNGDQPLSGYLELLR